MAQFQVRITQVTTNGPYASILMKDGVGIKATQALATPTVALDTARTDIAANLNGETVRSISIVVSSS